MPMITKHNERIDEAEKMESFGSVFTPRESVFEIDSGTDVISLVGFCIASTEGLSQKSIIVKPMNKLIATIVPIIFIFIFIPALLWIIVLVNNKARCGPEINYK